MKYLLRIAGPPKEGRKGLVAHLWNGADTVCRMFSTGGMKERRYRVADSAEGRSICQMCAAVEAGEGREAQFRSALDRAE